MPWYLIVWEIVKAILILCGFVAAWCLGAMLLQGAGAAMGIWDGGEHRQENLPSHENAAAHPRRKRFTAEEAALLDAQRRNEAHRLWRAQDGGKREE